MTMSVVRIRHRKEEATAFADAARKAEQKGLVYGVGLEHRLDNPRDPNGEAVIGIAAREGLFRRSVGTRHSVTADAVGVASWHLDLARLTL